MATHRHSATATAGTGGTADDHIAQSAHVSRASFPVDLASVHGPEWAAWARLAPSERWAASERRCGTFTGISEQPMPSTVNTILSAFTLHDVQYLLMGGQACSLYGGTPVPWSAHCCRSALRHHVPRRGPCHPLCLRRGQEYPSRSDAAYWSPLRQELESLPRAAAQGRLPMLWPPEPR